MKSKLKAVAWTAAGVVLGIIAHRALVSWAIDNDIPVLSDLM